jgi:DNA (cytosine-5)-methyltransferase 1
MLDVLVGGPPCQGHSDLNNYTRRRDPKNELYMLMVRAAEVLQPAHLIVENVQGIKRDHTGVLSRAVECLERIGYRVDHGLVHLVDIGVPQKRVRHILVASAESTPSLASAVKRCTVSPARDLSWAIRDLEANCSSGTFDSAGQLTSDNQKRALYLLKNNLFDLPNELRPPCHRDNPTHRYTAMYGRLSWTAPAHTITTGFGSPGQGRYLHPSQARTLTPHEAARVQFFPDWFDFGANSRRNLLAHCIGNAVPPKLGFVLALDRLLADSAAAAEAG